MFVHFYVWEFLNKMGDDTVTSNFLTCKVDANLTKEEQKKVVQSVELTKALVLMGFPTWSALEPGKCVLQTWQVC